MRKYNPPTDSEQCVEESVEENMAQVNMKENSFVSSCQSPKYMLTKAHRRNKNKKKPLVPPLGSLNENTEFADFATGFILSPRAEKPYRCHLCVKQFKYFSNLKSHMNIVHKKMIEQSHIHSKTSTVGNGQVFQCEICFRNFKYFSNLRTHRLVHTTSGLEAVDSD